MHSQLPKTNTKVPMPEVKKPKNDNLDNFIDILADAVCYLIAHGAGPDLSLNEKAMKLDQIHKSLKQYRNGKS